MDRVRYAGYLSARMAEAAAIAAGAALLASTLQSLGFVESAHWDHAGPASGLLQGAAWWAKPAACALLAHLLVGPKQTRPVYRKVPGAMFTYAGVSVDRNAGCRGGCVTGATGSGKTLACIVPRLHSLCVNESGVERRGGAAAGEETELERRRRRYRIPPWGGFICGEKGNEWQMIRSLLAHHGREEDLRVLATRPASAPALWSPGVRLNLISMEDIPADTYAKLVVETGLTVEEAGKRDEFFVPQARDKIAWGIRLTRAVARAGEDAGRNSVPAPSLLLLFDILTIQESYRRFLLRACEENSRLDESAAFREARFQLENNYWNQPPDQLGGVRSTIYNFLVPFTEPEVAEVFCADSTFDLRDIQLGVVVCLAIPQKFAVQRRYIATLMKCLTYQIILQRFDRTEEDAGWQDRNVILVEQDEWQRHAVRADCEADVVREARGAVYTAAAQSQNAVWAKLGGREAAAPLLANLRNRWICQAATDECADESSKLASGRISRELSFSSGQGSRTTTVSFSERPFLSKRELRSLPPFHVVFVPAEGPWLYRKCIAMPATADGRIPPWWFGDWNPLHWVSHSLGLPERLGRVRLHPGNRFIPPWRASAPARAQFRRLLGLDGTFIILGGERARNTGGVGK